MVPCPLSLSGSVSLFLSVVCLSFCPSLSLSLLVCLFLCPTLLVSLSVGLSLRFRFPCFPITVPSSFSLYVFTCHVPCDWQRSRLPIIRKEKTFLRRYGSRDQHEKRYLAVRCAVVSTGCMRSACTPVGRIEFREEEKKSVSLRYDPLAIIHSGFW